MCWWSALDPHYHHAAKSNHSSFHPRRVLKELLGGNIPPRVFPPQMSYCQSWWSWRTPSWGYLEGVLRRVYCEGRSKWSLLWSSPALWAARPRCWAAAGPLKCWWSETPGWGRPASHTGSAPESSPAGWRPPSGWTSEKECWTSTERKLR